MSCCPTWAILHKVSHTNASSCSFLALAVWNKGYPGCAIGVASSCWVCDCDTLLFYLLNYLFYSVSVSYYCRGYGKVEEGIDYDYLLDYYSESMRWTGKVDWYIKYGSISHRNVTVTSTGHIFLLHLLLHHFNSLFLDVV